MGKGLGEVLYVVLVVHPCSLADFGQGVGPM